MAIRVSEDEEGRFIEIPQRESYEGYDEMLEFIETVSDSHLRDRLEDAVSGKGAFRRFKNVLLEYPGERQRWFDFQASNMNRRALEWLDSIGIEPI